MSKRNKTSSSRRKALRKRGKKSTIDTRLPSAAAAQKAAEDYANAATPPPESQDVADAGLAPFPEPVKAYNNLDFLASSGARSIRIQCELAEPAVRFRKHQVNSTIVLFGSARIAPPDRAEKELERLEKEIGQQNSITREQKDQLDRARRLKRAAPYYESARRLSYDLTQWSLEKIPHPGSRFYICSGGGPGIMEAANRGAHEAGGQSVGLGISLPFEQHLNTYTPNDLGFEFHYFFVRKYWFLYLAKALVVFPGGFGTMDELFEMLTLVQTQKVQKYVPVVLFGTEFWHEVVNFKALVDWGVISREDLDLFRFSDSVEETRDYLIDELSRYYL